MMRILGALLCALLLVTTATGCGNGDENKAKASLAKLMRGKQGDLGLSKKEATCTAGELVDGVGLKHLLKYDIITKDFTANKSPENVKMSKSDADAAASAITDCIDIVSAVTKSAGKQFSAAQKACLKQKLTKSAMRTMWSAYFQGKNDAATQALLKPVTECAGVGTPKS